MNTRTLLAAASALTLASCAADGPVTTQEVAAETAGPVAASMRAEDARLVAFLDEAWEAQVARSPEYQAYLGRKTNQDRWDDRSFEADDERRAQIEEQLAALRAGFDRDDLSAEGKLNYDLFEYTLENDLALDEFRIQQFNLSQFRGVHSNIPVFLANYHAISSVEEAEAYIARVRATPTVLDQAAAQLEARIEAGYPLPAFSYPLIEEGARAISGGEPIADDFQKKLDALETDDDTRARLREELSTAIETALKPAYEDFASRVAALAEADVVDGDFGVGIREGGEAYYDALLRNYTTTEMTADEVHELGLSEVARIQDEMRAIMAEVGFEGDLQDFFEFMRTSDQFYYDNTAEDREAYLEDARRYTEGMRALHHAARGPRRGAPRRALPRARGGQGLLQPARPRRLAPRHLLREPRRDGRHAEVPAGGARLP